MFFSSFRTRRALPASRDSSTRPESLSFSCSFWPGPGQPSAWPGGVPPREPSFPCPGCALIHPAFHPGGSGSYPPPGTSCLLPAWPGGVFLPGRAVLPCPGFLSCPLIQGSIFTRMARGSLSAWPGSLSHGRGEHHTGLAGNENPSQQQGGPCWRPGLAPAR